MRSFRLLYLSGRTVNGPQDTALARLCGSGPGESAKLQVWRASLVTNLGAHYKRTGYFTRDGESLAEGWSLTKGESSPTARATGERALSELLELYMQFGRLDRL